jgi:hypothetical protein
LEASIAKAPLLSICCSIASWIWPVLAVSGWSTAWLVCGLPTNLYFSFNARTKVARFRDIPRALNKRQWVIEKLSCTWISIISYLFDLDDKCSCTWIDTGYSIGAIGSLEANPACETVTIKIGVHAVAAIWSSSQRIRDQVCATRLTIPNRRFCKGIKFGIVIKH